MSSIPRKRGLKSLASASVMIPGRGIGNIFSPNLYDWESPQLLCPSLRAMREAIDSTYSGRSGKEVSEV